MSEDTLSAADDDAPLRLTGDDGDSSGEAVDRAIGCSYAAGTPLDRGQRLHELFPSRFLTIGLVTVAGLAMVAALETLHVWARSVTDALAFAPHQLSALDLGASGNVSQWFAAMLLGVAALITFSVYSLRRHRLDDYNGRYRIWLWTGSACLLASLAETTTVSLLGKGLCHRVADTCGLSGWAVWPAVLGIPLGALAVRSLIEVWRCRLATSALALAIIAFLLAAAIHFGLIAEVSGDNGPLVQRGSWLAGYVLMLTSFLLYARHVSREIAGLIATPPLKVRRKKKKRASTGVPEIIDEAPKQKLAASRSDLEPVRTSLRADDAHSARHESLRVDTQYDRGLSKAERRRLRREARRSA